MKTKNQSDITKQLFQLPYVTFDELTSLLAACKFFARFKGKSDEYEPIYRKLKTADIIDLDSAEEEYLLRYLQV